MKDNNDMPGHLARRFQQIAVAVFLAEVGEAGFDLTPVQYAALATIKANPGQVSQEEILKRLDRLSKEVEELRRAIRK